MNSCTSCVDEQSTHYMGEEYLKYRIAVLDRYIPYLWKILNGQIEMPNVFIYIPGSSCKACQCLGEINNKPCTVCRGSGKMVLTTKQQYNNIFKKFVKAKKDKLFFEQALREKQYEKYRVLGIKEARPNKKDWLCVKCEHNYSGNRNRKENPCLSCVNYKQGNLRGYRNFKPISKTTEKWYREKGFRLNFDYQNRANKRTKVTSES